MSVVEQAPEQSRPRRRWLVPVIVVSALAALAFIIVGVVVVAQVVGGAIQNRLPPDQPLVVGQVGSPLPAVPLACAEPCFTTDIVKDLLPAEGDFEALGFPDETYPFGTYDPTTAGQLYRAGSAGWKANQGDPAECAFAPSNSPFLAELDPSTAESLDPVYFLSTHEDAEHRDVVDMSVRVFEDSASATDFLTDLATSIAACTIVTFGSDEDFYIAQIDPGAALDLPDDVAAVGWIRTGDPGIRWRAYSFDLARGNLVVRVRLFTDGAVTEERFREWVVEYTAQLAALPVP